MTKNVAKLKARETKELIRREKQLGARSNKFYLIYLFMILSLIYITDEIASTISIQFQSNIVTEFFVKNMGMEYGAGLSLFSAIGFISYPVTLLIVFYRPLADRFGRKPFLVINTLCMGLGLFLVYLSKDIYVYMIGGTLMGFMVSHDMQCVYILECSDEKSRARNYAIVNSKSGGDTGHIACSAASHNADAKCGRTLARSLSCSCNYRLCYVAVCVAFCQGNKCVFNKENRIPKNPR